MIEKIVSGGQTGVDQAALEVAMAFNIPHGGKCPKGRIAENGLIPEKYLLMETQSSDPNERTLLNIQESQATLVIVPSMPLTVTDGTILTLQTLKKLQKKYYVFTLSESHESEKLIAWIKDNNITILNIAGPRESSSPGIYHRTFLFLTEIFKKIFEFKK